MAKPLVDPSSSFWQQHSPANNSSTMSLDGSEANSINSSQPLVPFTRRGPRTRVKRSRNLTFQPLHTIGRQVDSEPKKCSVWDDETPKHMEEALVLTTSCLKTQQDDALRRFAVQHLEKMLAKWSPLPQKTGASSSAQTTTSPPVNPWNRARPTLITFGSYRLGVHREDSDLDVLALCPPEYTRSDFFQSWVALLQQDPRVSGVHPIAEAYTPVIKFYFSKRIQVDMLFARVADGTKLRDFQKNRVSPVLKPTAAATNKPGDSKTSTTKDRAEYYIDDSDLQDQDEAGVRSLNGARVSQILLESVADLHKFRIVLRAVKEWAIAKGVYSNVLGFLGGVNYAILVACVCCRYPKENAPTLLLNFFHIFSNWNWPEPVALLPIQANAPRGAPQMPVWDPSQNPRDGLHVMPIVTPAYPSMNSSYNVGLPQLRRIQEEMKRAFHILNNSSTLPPTIRIISKKEDNASASVAQDNVFSKLFAKSNFFSCHENFLQVTVRAPNKQDYLQWFRLVESRLRILIADLETPELHAWPFSHFFEHKYDGEGYLMTEPGRWAEEDGFHESLFFIALRGATDMNLIPFTSNFLYSVNSWRGKNEGMDISVTPVRAHELPTCCKPILPPAHNYMYAQKENAYNQYETRGMYPKHNGQAAKKFNKNNKNRANNNNKNRNSGQRQPLSSSSHGVKAAANSRGTNPDASLASMTSSSGSYDRAETDETYSLESDASIASSSSNLVPGNMNVVSGCPTRICVFEGAVAPSAAAASSSSFE